jgi:hypothetical protein
MVVIGWSAPDTRQVTRTADSLGRVTVNLSSIEQSGYRLPHGTHIDISCVTAAGDVIGASPTAP